MSETHIRNAILSWLKLHKALVFIHDSVGIFDSRINAYRVRSSVHKRLGVSDILGIWRNQFLAIEVKGERGKLSPHQKVFLQDVNEHGGIGFMARGIEDVERELRQRGQYP